MQKVNPDYSLGNPIRTVTKGISLALFACFLLSSCSELEARRSIQKGDKLYEEGKYAEAIELYEESLASTGLATGHHNLAISAYTAFQPGIETKANLLFAEKASKHFQEYLKLKPDDQIIIGLMTTVWVNSDRMDAALAFWEEERKKKPTSLKPVQKLRSIQVMAGNYKEALKWDYKRVELAKEPKDKVLALVQIGQLQYSRLAKKSLVDAERIEVADSGIAALTQALEMQPENANLHSLIATIYQFRSMAHQAGWARLTDAASQRYHHIERKRLVDAAKLKQENKKSNQGVSKEKGQNSDEATKGSKE